MDLVYVLFRQDIDIANVFFETDYETVACADLCLDRCVVDLDSVVIGSVTNTGKFVEFLSFKGKDNNGTGFWMIAS